MHDDLAPNISIEVGVVTIILYHSQCTYAHLCMIKNLLLGFTSHSTCLLPQGSCILWFASEFYICWNLITMIIFSFNFRIEISGNIHLPGLVSDGFFLSLARIFKLFFVFWLLLREIHFLLIELSILPRLFTNHSIMLPLALFC